MATTTKYPLPKFHFQVQWGGASLAFSEASGLNFETQVIEYRDGLSPEYSTIKMPGLKKYPNITLKRGVVKGDNDFYKWWNTTAMNTTERRDITIMLLDEKHQPVVIWKAKNAWASKIDGGSYNATGNEVAIENIEIVHEGMTIEHN